ncbi:hypothetical protein [Methylocella sp.]|uniref:hypothetical protein n=1 Tax=Methylocella sp. TaxID=1978226 RepID=UPI0035AD91E9
MTASEPREDAAGAGEARMIGLAELLRRSGAVLVQAAGRLAAVEDALGDAFDHRPDAAATRRVQDLDALRQEAAALGAFLLRLAREAPPVALDAGAALRATPLARLAERLAGEPEAGSAGARDIELF